MGFGVLVLSGLAAAPHPAHPEAGPGPDDLRVRTEETWDSRLERLSRPWRGAPYLRSPLGEGEAPDTDVRLRFDAFDCTTFVETALATARVESPQAIEAELDRIRYDGEVGFGRRRHLVVSQWIPALVEQGILQDITQTIGGRATQRIPFRIGPKRWARRRIAATLELPPHRVPKGRFPVDVIPLEALRRRASSVPAGTLINLVRVNWPLSPILVTHQGLVLRDPKTKRLVLRHASPSRKRVLDEPLLKALARWAKPERKWPIAGVSLFAISAGSGPDKQGSDVRPSPL